MTRPRHRLGKRWHWHWHWHWHWCWCWRWRWHRDIATTPKRIALDLRSEMPADAR